MIRDVSSWLYPAASRNDISVQVVAVQHTAEACRVATVKFCAEASTHEEIGNQKLGGSALWGEVHSSDHVHAGSPSGREGGVGMVGQGPGSNSRWRLEVAPAACMLLILRCGDSLLPVSESQWT